MTVRTPLTLTLLFGIFGPLGACLSAATSDEPTTEGSSALSPAGRCYTKPAYLLGGMPSHRPRQAYIAWRQIEALLAMKLYRSLTLVDAAPAVNGNSESDFSSLLASTRAAFVRNVHDELARKAKQAKSKAELIANTSANDYFFNHRQEACASDAHVYVVAPSREWLFNQTTNAYIENENFTQSRRTRSQ